MALITRKLLARGSKLLADHVFNPLADAATALDGDVGHENLSTPYAPMRLPFVLPLVDGSGFVDSALRAGHFCIPFVLPLPQDLFDTGAQALNTDPDIILDEVQISFDTRREAAVIQGSSFASDGYMIFGAEDDAYDMNLTLKEKKMTVFDSTASYVPEVEVFSLDLDHALFLTKNNRQNPFIRTGLEKVISPYKTYVLYLDASSLDDVANHYALVTCNIELRFRVRLMERDKWHITNYPVQNIPVDHDGAQNGATVTISAPASGADIEADTADGVQTNLELVDGAFLGRLKGGYGMYGDAPPEESILDDAALSVIPVPMWQTGEPITRTNLTRCPYFGGTYTNPTCDRRIVPIYEPFVLHHVVAAVSYANRGVAGGVHPTGAALLNQLGVALLSGIHSDHFDYQQLAYLEWTPANKAGYIIDYIKEVLDGSMTTGDWDYELFQIPMVYPAAGPIVGTGYPLTSPYDRKGYPIYCGRGNNSTNDRRTIASAVAGVAQTPVTLGVEQAFEVRWLLKDPTNGMDDAPTYPGNTTFIGQNGFWVFLIGKTHLAGGMFDGNS